MTSFNLHASVTEDYILVGDPGDCNSCPIALALEGAAKQQGLDPKVTYVDGQYAVLYTGREPPYGKFGADMPRAGKNFIRTFDEGFAVEPIELDFQFQKG